jgi:hypothetical protein
MGTTKGTKKIHSTELLLYGCWSALSYNVCIPSLQIIIGLELIKIKIKIKLVKESSIRWGNYL